MTIKRTWLLPLVILLVLELLGGIAWWAYDRYLATPEPTPAAAATPPAEPPPPLAAIEPPVQPGASSPAREEPTPAGPDGGFVPFQTFDSSLSGSGTAPPATTVAREAPSPVAPVADGTLIADSRPRGAMFLIDGRFSGITPQRIELTPGRYEVTFKREGYHDKGLVVEIAEGKETRIRPSLEVAIQRSRVGR